ncbi:MAG: pyrroline-5-carboxylate reductase [Bacillota bacterium]|nr:pyrroline-5-carboxylate reductase [Bacillota bacterium]
MWTGGRLAVLGAGVMGQAIVKGVVRRGLIAPEQVMAVDLERGKLEKLREETGCRITTQAAEAVSWAETVLLALKPQVIREVWPQWGPSLRPQQTVISIAAGISTAYLEEHLPAGTPVVRVMPNSPALVGQGAAAVSPGRSAGEEHVQRALSIFTALGRAITLPEGLLDAVTGLSGSGPAYVYLAIEALAEGGVRMGLPREAALLLAAQTALGAAAMVLETGLHPAELKGQVTTPGGTTAAGLFCLEEAAVRAALIRAVEAATARSRELGAPAAERRAKEVER